MHAIEAVDVVREHAPGRGVCGVSLTVEAGMCYAVLGRNGSGKTTLTHLLAGLQRPDAGSLAVLGLPLGTGSRKHLARCGIVLDRSVHWDELSGRQNAHFVARTYGMTPRAIDERLDALFDAADLSAQAEDPVKTYSFGMRRKLSVIESLAHEPELLLLDEPTAGVDAQFELWLTEEIARRCRKGLSTWVVSNDPDWVAAVAARVAFMDAGLLLAEDTVERLLADVLPLRELQITLQRVEPIDPPQIDGVRLFTQDGERLTALLEPDPALLGRVIDALLADGHDIRGVEVRKGSLRDAFLAKTGKAVDA